MQKTFNFYSDPGHGWVKVPIKLLDELSIRNKISSYSYVRGDFAYLEEDCDAAEFIGAIRARGIEPKFHELMTNKMSKIRSYNCYLPRP